jgi:hypothetical protein
MAGEAGMAASLPQQLNGDAGDARGHRFAFILHPLTVDYLPKHPRYTWTRHLPRKWLEVSAAHMPARYVGTARGGRSPATGKPVHGLIYALGATPRQMLTRPPEFTYSRLDAAVRDAAAHGAKIVGLGAFTKVVGDAGITVAKRAPIPVTTGNSLTIAATLETAKLTAIRLGWPSLAKGKAMIVGATGAIGSVKSAFSLPRQSPHGPSAVRTLAGSFSPSSGGMATIRALRVSGSGTKPSVIALKFSSSASGPALYGRSRSPSNSPGSWTEGSNAERSSTTSPRISRMP